MNPSDDQPRAYKRAIVELDLADAAAVETLGSETLARVERLSTHLTAHARAAADNDSSAALAAMIDEVAGLRVNPVARTSWLRRLPLIGELFEPADGLGERFERARRRLDVLEARLLAERERLNLELREIGALQTEHAAVADELSGIVAAAEDLVVDGDAGVDPNMVEALERLAGRIRLLRTAALATAQGRAQLGLAADSRRNLIRAFSEVLEVALPLWEREHQLAMTAYGEQRSLSTLREVRGDPGVLGDGVNVDVEVLVARIAARRRDGEVDREGLGELTRLTVESIQLRLERARAWLGMDDEEG